ncbi:MAG: response regulator [Bdellovibrionaceae bacterium]|nr:response regulator [Pseudobdellovibrionaceae bacterium]
MADIVDGQVEIATVSVLVVDDDAMVRSVLVEYLQSFGFVRIYDVKGGRQAMKLINDLSVPIDLILADWQMPEVDGLQLLKLTRNNPARKDVKFIMITSQVPEERIKITKARLAGVDSYIVKPFKGRLLHEKIWDVLGWKREDDEKTG